MTRTEVEAKYGSIRRVGSVFGWLTHSPDLYVLSSSSGTSGLAVVQRSDCLIVYALSGGP